MSVARIPGFGGDRARPSLTLFRLMGWGDLVRWVFIAAIVVQLVLTRQTRVILLGLVPGVPLSPVEMRWLVVCLIAPYLGVAVWSRIDTLRETGFSRGLPGLADRLREGLRLFTLGVAGLAGLAAALLGAGPGEALGLASLASLVILLGYGVSEWRSVAPGSLFVALLVAPVVLYIGAPALPGWLGEHHPWAAAALGSLLAVSLFRALALPIFRPTGREEGTEPGHTLGSGTETSPLEERAMASAPASTWKEEQVNRALTKEARARGIPGASGSAAAEPPTRALPAPLPPRAWAQAPLRTALRCWEAEAEGSEGISPWMAAGAAVPAVVLVVAITLWVTLQIGVSHLLVPIALSLRLAMLQYPGSLSLVPLSRRERADLMWLTELVLALGFVAAFGAGMIVAGLVAPDRMAALSGPHPLVVLGTILAAYPLVGFLITRRFPGRSPGSHGSRGHGWAGWSALGTLLGLALVAVSAVALSELVHRAILAASWVEGAILMLVMVTLLPAAALGLLRWHHARSTLGPQA